MTVQAVLAPLICAALCWYVHAKKIGGDYLSLWAIGFGLIGVTIVSGAVVDAPTATDQILLGWTVLTLAVSGATMFIFFGTLSLIGYPIPLRQAALLTFVICLVLQVVQYADLFLLRLGMVGFTAAMMFVTAILFFTRGLSIFYRLAGVTTLLRASNSAVYVVMVDNNVTDQVLPYFTSSTTVFVNLTMGLCIMLITFDNAQKNLKAANDAERAAKQISEELYREKEAILHALDSSQDRIVIEDPQGRVRYINQVVADIWSHGSKSNIIGKPFNEAFPLLKRTRDAILPKARGTLSAGEVWHDEFESLRPDGRRARNVVRITPLPDHGILYTVEDVTEVYKREQREQQLKKQLIEAQRMESVGRLAGGVAHDFNNIIAAIRAFAALIGDAIAPEVKAHSFAKRIVDSCDRATELVRQILLFSRATQADLKPIPMAEVIGEVHQYVKASMPANISLKKCRASISPSTATPGS
jgi:PAS domain S-box-containing protein